MKQNNIKYIAKEGDYYFCSCPEHKKWHRVNLSDKNSEGFKHLKYIDLEQSNSPDAKYFYCLKCRKWHKTIKSPQCLPYRAKLRKAKNHDSWIKNPQISKSLNKSKKLRKEIPEYDGVFWLKKEEIIERISYSFPKEKCIELINKTEKLYDECYIHIFPRKDGFSFFVKGLKIAELSIKPPEYVITLEKNELKEKNLTSVRKEKNEMKIIEASISEVIEHLKSESRNLILLRESNRIGYIEKWLHCLLIEKMKVKKFGDLEFLYYEAPAGRIGWGRTHIDLLAKDRFSGELTVIEVKKSKQDIDEAICQGLSYLRWLRENEYPIQKKIDELNWGVYASKSKLIIITPDLFLLKDISEKIKNFVHRFNLKVEIISLKSDWEKNEILEIINQFEI